MTVMGINWLRKSPAFSLHLIPKHLVDFLPCHIQFAIHIYLQLHLFFQIPLQLQRHKMKQTLPNLTLRASTIDHLQIVQIHSTHRTPRHAKRLNYERYSHPFLRAGPSTPVPTLRSHALLAPRSQRLRTAHTTTHFRPRIRRGRRRARLRKQKT